MVWTVVYRDSDGNRASVEIESVDRNAVFAELQRRGITAISVSEGKSKLTRQGRRISSGGRLSTHPYRGIVGGLIVVVCTVAAWLWLSSGETGRVPPASPVEKKTSDTPVSPRITTPIKDATGDAPMPEKPKRFWQLPSTNGLTEAQQQIYSTTGGTPHLDGQYTVFGEVIEGLDIVGKIQEAATRPGDRPKEDIFMNVSIVEE